jgi:hypothetical protein
MLQWVASASTLAAGALAIYIYFRVKGYLSVDSSGERLREGFSLARYEPMKRILSEEDLEFLKCLRGVQPKSIRKLRAQREQIFKTYLRELVADFRELHREARALVASAPEEYADLVEVVMRQQVRFWMTLAGVEFRLGLRAMGIGSVDVSGLLAAVDALQARMPRLEEHGLELA